MKMSWITALVCATLAASAGCDDSSPNFQTADGGTTDTDTDGDTDTDSDTDTDTDTDSDTDTGSQACEDMLAFFQGCGALEAQLTELSTTCAAMDDALVDPFLEAFVACITGYDCGDFPADEEGDETDLFDLCFQSAGESTTPPSQNEDMIQTYCTYASGCDSSLTMQECVAELSEGFIFLFLEDNYVAELSACFDGSPGCAQAATVEICVQGVLSSIPFIAMLGDDE